MSRNLVRCGKCGVPLDLALERRRLEREIDSLMKLLPKLAEARSVRQAWSDYRKVRAAVGSSKTKRRRSS